jgi:hypothetical protein
VTAVSANTFQTYSDGTDAQTAFHDAVEQAGWEHGHGGYTGTIAEKTDYVIITREPMSHDDASRLAGNLLHGDDPRVADKWGPGRGDPRPAAHQPGRAARPGRLAVLRLCQQLTHSCASHGTGREPSPHP